MSEEEQKVSYKLLRILGFVRLQRVDSTGWQLDDSWVDRHFIFKPKWLRNYPRQFPDFKFHRFSKKEDMLVAEFDRGKMFRIIATFPDGGDFVSLPEWQAPVVPEKKSAIAVPGIEADVATNHDPYFERPVAKMDEGDLAMIEDRLKRKYECAPELTAEEKKAADAEQRAIEDEILRTKQMLENQDDPEAIQRMIEEEMKKLEQV